MILVVDTSAWIEFLKGRGSSFDHAVTAAIKDHTLLVPDVVRLEILRGMKDDREAAAFAKDLSRFETVAVGGLELADVGAANYRSVRAKGFTVRSTIDLMIGTWCIANAVPLLHNDRDFDVMERYLGLKVWQAIAA